MPAVLLALTFLIFDWLASGNALAARSGDSLGGALPQLPTGFAPEAEAPPPTAGEDVPSSPSLGWRVSGGLLSPAASPLRPSDGPASAPAELSCSGSGVPFISASPAVPLPTAVTDGTAAALHQDPTTGDGAHEVASGFGLRHKARTRLLPLFVAITVSTTFWACMFEP